MLSISHKLRLPLGVALVATSVTLYLLVNARIEPAQSRSIIHITQRKGPPFVVPLGPTQMTASVPTDVLIAFPAEMKVDETRSISLSVRVVISSDDRFFKYNSTDTETEPEEAAVPKVELGNDIEVKLISSGFEVQGISTAKQGASFPIIFRWTISPKKEGRHEVLIDLSQVIASSSVQEAVVKVGGRQVELMDSAYLPLEIHVIGPFDMPVGLANVATSLLTFLGSFLGAVIMSPSFERWLRRKLKRS